MPELKAYQVELTDDSKPLFIAAHDPIQALGILRDRLSLDTFKGITEMSEGDQRQCLAWLYDYQHSVMVDDELANRRCCEIVIAEPDSAFSARWNNPYVDTRASQETIDAYRDALDEIREVESITVADMVRMAGAPAYLCDQTTFAGEHIFEPFEIITGEVSAHAA